MSPEIVPENYTAACNDHNDGYVGVIVIYKKWLKKMLLNSLGVVPIKIETFEKSVIICACYWSPNSDNASNDSLSSNMLTICKK